VHGCGGTPADASNFTKRAAISGVGSAGFRHHRCCRPRARPSPGRRRCKGKFQGLCRRNTRAVQGQISFDSTRRTCRNASVARIAAAPHRVVAAEATASRTSRWRRRDVFLLSPAPKVHVNSARPASSRSAPLSRQAARASPPAQIQRGWAAAPGRNAMDASAGVASRTLPTASRRSAGLVTGFAYLPGQADPLMMGPATATAWLSGRLTGDGVDTSLHRLKLSGIAKSIPRAVRRSDYNAYGQRAARDEQRMFPSVRSRIWIANDLGKPGNCSSMKRFTNDVVARSRAGRRTRIRQQVLCSPTGA